MSAKTERELRDRYRDAVSAFLSELSDIDNELPWSALEPEWWVEMQRVDRAVRAAMEPPK